MDCQILQRNVFLLLTSQLVYLENNTDICGHILLYGKCLNTAAVGVFQLVYSIILYQVLAFP